VHPIPGAFGGIAAGADQAPRFDIPEWLASRSDVEYQTDRFPAEPGLKQLLEHILVEEGVPGEFGALPWIESSYQIGCYSSMGAAGPWQLVRETARNFDLRIDSEVDERFSWVSSTRAAARLLRYLRNRFGNWTLALAAYNCGEGTVAHAIAGGDSSFLELDLPGETDAFVPRFASALAAYRQVDDRGRPLSIVWVPPSTDLRVLAAACGTSPESLISLNRCYLKECTPSYGDGWDLVVPSALAGEAFTRAWQIDGDRYEVAPGDSWASIAGVLGIPEESLRAANAGSVIEPGTLLKLPEPDDLPVNVCSGEAEGFFWYTVRSGDTLGEIGEMVGASSTEVAVWNDISRTSTIYPGQRLVLRGTAPDGQQAAPPPASQAPATGSRVTHAVEVGDTLWDLALEYGVTVEQISELNSLSGTNLRIGQVLIIRE
jgi:membrane-bound lytic murein transglycosylase D